jgi:REP-associated tyrosine transposase
MGKSLVKNYIHLVFSTKYREPLIQPPFDTKLHKYIGGVCNRMESQPIIVGGYTDHIHILCRLSKKLALMKLVEEIKSHSSKWMKTNDCSLSHFYWQNGYGAFSVNPGDADGLIYYIRNQYGHHTQKSFKEEFRNLLVLHKVDFTEDYLWE